jgi:opacity protein-like surface antigen
MKILLFFFVVVMFVGCATIPQGTTPSSSPLVAENGTVKTYEIIGNSEGSAGHFTLFGFIPFGRTDIDEAIQNALTPYKGDNLINVHYYVNSAFYFIGNSTSITVKGDVIKYTDKEKVTGDKKQVYYKPTEVIGNLTHCLSLGSAIDGLYIGYSLSKPLNDFLFYQLSLGYKHYETKETINENWWGNNYSFEVDHKYDAIPVSFNIGVNARKFLDIPIPLNPFASIGVSYIPIVGGETQWDQVGINFNLGAIYEFTKGIAVGIDYRYIKSFIELGGYYNSNNEGIGFSNLNLNLIIYP